MCAYVLTEVNLDTGTYTQVTTNNGQKIVRNVFATVKCAPLSGYCGMLNKLITQPLVEAATSNGGESIKYKKKQNGMYEWCQCQFQWLVHAFAIWYYACSVIWRIERMIKIACIMQIDLLDVFADYVVTFSLMQCNQLSAHLNIPVTSYPFLLYYL